MIGKKFGKWVILDRLPARYGKATKWLCRCECGVVKEIDGNSMRRGDSKSCGCELKLQPYEYLYKILLNNIRLHRIYIKVELTLEQFLTFTTRKNCEYCNVPIRWSEKNIRGGKVTGYNLDRKDNSIGYTLENCVVCCKRCNIAKFNHFTYEEWKLIGAFISTWK